MSLENKLHEELLRYKSINNYITEQEEIPADELPTGDEPEGDAPIDDVPAVEPEGDAPIDAPIEDSPDADVEEIDITDLVNMTQNIKNDLDASKSDNDQVISKMGDLFSKLDDLEGKLSQMDNVIAKIDGLESKVEDMKEPTPQEKLEMRSLDSYPFNQNPSEFFKEKQLDMKNSGKNEYVISKSDIEDYNQKEMRDSFVQDDEEEDVRF